MSTSTPTSKRQAIIDAALDCFRRHGLAKTTVVDIGRAAGLSRGTIYAYFADKAAIVEATAEATSRRFYSEMARAMNSGSLAEKLTSGATFVWHARKAMESENFFDEGEIGVLLTKNAGVLLRECVDFVAPYLRSAQLTGELREDLDVQVAGEVFARLLFSLFSAPSSTLDLDDPAVLRCLVRDHLVRGFANPSWREEKPARAVERPEETAK